MALCDLCGSGNAVTLGLIENSELALCSACSKYSKRTRPLTEKKQIVREEREEYEEQLNPGYAKLMREKREELRLTHSEAAELLQTGVNILKKIENGKLEPDNKLIELVRKSYGLDLTSKQRISISKKELVHSPLTIGHIIKRGAKGL